jgi:hypothetical protein
MYNSRVQRRQSRKRSCRRNRKTYGGGNGLSYSLSGSIDPNNPSLGNASRVVPFSSCGNTVSPGRINDVGTQGGVPGFSSKQYGGRRSNSAMRDPIDVLMKLASQTGGGYTPNFVNGSNPFMDRPYSGCGEGAYAVKNTLNEVSPSTLTAPPAVQGALLKGGRNSRKYRSLKTGGARVYPVDTMVYEAPNSGYTFVPSNSTGGSAGTLADGKVPFQVSVPYTAQPSGSSACIKTGGRRKSRKNRKGSHKNRRNSRRN